MHQMYNVLIYIAAYLLTVFKVLEVIFNSHKSLLSKTIDGRIFRDHLSIIYRFPNFACYLFMLALNHQSSGEIFFREGPMATLGGPENL